MKQNRGDHLETLRKSQEKKKIDNFEMCHNHNVEKFKGGPFGIA